MIIRGALAYCQALGANTVWDYHTTNWWEKLPADSVDVVYDCVGQAGTPDRAMNVLKAGGS
jgi:NADPH:quinone reductase-like Zn-dependent oxidoreductase